MSRPLVITDCDEVLLHMVRHFRDWMDQAHGIAFSLDGNPFAQDMVRPGTSEPMSFEDKWRYLDAFFEGEMDRQTEIDGAGAALAELGQNADVVVLTNLQDRFNHARVRQLQSHGIDVPVFTNQGPKGPAIRRILEQYRPSRAVFVDDLGHHHASAAETVPEVSRLHLVGEPAIAPHIECAHQSGHAHARIDSWAQALPWLQRRLEGEQP